MNTATLTKTTAAYFAARRIGHVNLYVSDVDQSYAFYKQVAGLDEAYVQPHNKAAFFSNNNTHHDVGVIDISGPIARAKAPGLNHLGFEIETEVDLVTGYDRAIEDGVTFFMTQDHDIAHSVYGHDPDGLLVEIYADVVEDWRNARSGVVTKGKPKWTPGLTPPVAERNYHVNPTLTRVAEAVFQPRRIMHATLVVADMAAAEQFYTKMVGLAVVERADSGACTILSGTTGEPCLALFAAGEGRAPGLHHFGFEMWSDAELVASAEKARAAGITIESESDVCGRHSVFVRDPDGFSLQFFCDRAGANTLSAINGINAISVF